MRECSLKCTCPTCDHVIEAGDVVDISIRWCPCAAPVEEDREDKRLEELCFEPAADVAGVPHAFEADAMRQLMSRVSESLSVIHVPRYL